jgi:hypothetical protein
MRLYTPHSYSMVLRGRDFTKIAPKQLYTSCMPLKIVRLKPYIGISLELENQGPTNLEPPNPMNQEPHGQNLQASSAS